MAKSKTTFKNNSLAIKKALETSSKEILEAMARLTDAQTKRNIIRGAKTGKTYNVPGTSVSYRASAPGQSPANRTGNLAASYASQSISSEKSIVYSRLKYAKIEFGYGNVAPRPALRPAKDKIMKSKNEIIMSVMRNLK